ncbi:MAG: pentapeptide repeat-containing protein, partial [Opitutales bacterium]|nr:pentapeptide repeat-containing protein [Opitutales bacterium]
MKNSFEFTVIFTLLLSGLFSSQTFGQDYRGQDISALSLSGTDLSGAQFDNSTTFSSGGTGVNLSGTNAVLSGISGSVDFSGVNLASVSFTGSDLSGAAFDAQTVFSHFDPGTGQQQGVNLSGTNAVLSGIYGSVNFSGVNLASVSFTGSDLSAATFDAQTVFSDGGFGANLAGTNAVLSGISGSVNFSGVNLASLSFPG